MGLIKEKERIERANAELRWEPLVKKKCKLFTNACPEWRGLVKALYWRAFRLRHRSEEVRWDMEDEIGVEDPCHEQGFIAGKGPKL